MVDTGTHIRHMIRRDMTTLLRIENECFDFPWSEENLLACLRKPHIVGMIAEVDDETVGYMIFEIHMGHLQILNMAVDPIHQNNGVGTAMTEELVRRLVPGRREKIMTEISETSLDAQVFFSHRGFKAVQVLHDFYDEPDQMDAYLFVYRLSHQKRAEAVKQGQPINRIDRYIAG